MPIENNSPQLALPITFDDNASFENFLVTEHSELIAALQTGLIAFDKNKLKSDRGEQKIVYLYGASGSGKSHLMFALQRLAKETSKGSYYLSSVDWSIL